MNEGPFPAIGSGVSRCRAALLLLALAMAGCDESPPATRVTLARRADVAAVRPSEAQGLPAGHRPLRVAVASILSPTRTLDGYHDLLTYMGEQLGRPVRLVQRGTYAEVNDLLRNREIDVAFVCAGALLDGERTFGMRAIAVPQVGGKTSYYSYLIVPSGSPAKRLEDLRHASFAFSDPLSNSGRLAPVFQLAVRGENAERFFSRTVFTYSHDNSILAVSDGLVDAAAVDSLVYDYLRTRNPEAVAATRIIARWGPYGIPPVAVHPDLDPGERRALRELLFGIHATPRGRQVLERLLIDRFVEVDPALYRSIREMEVRVHRR
jgi:phosphonate transport system substrate-binding protein